MQNERSLNARDARRCHLENIPDRPLFPGRKEGQYKSYGDAHSFFKKEAVKIGFDKAIGTHQLLRTLATRMIQLGMSIVMLAKVLGHASTEITFKTYIHVMPCDLESAAKLMTA